jgi:hypothetical protein
MISTTYKSRLQKDFKQRFEIALKSVLRYGSWSGYTNSLPHWLKRFLGPSAPSYTRILKETQIV